MRWGHRFTGVEQPGTWRLEFWRVPGIGTDFKFLVTSDREIMGYIREM